MKKPMVHQGGPKWMPRAELFLLPLLIHACTHVERPERSVAEPGLAEAAAPGPSPTNGAAFASFVEPGFPFIVSTVDARGLGPAFSERNVATRGVVLMLGNDAYATFDPDLLRMAVGWHGEFLKLGTMAQVSYNEAGNKNNAIPTILGRPIFTTGVYPGWMGATAKFRDPRPAGPNPEEVGRGPIPTEVGRWNGVYVVGDEAVLSYTVRGTDIVEQPGSVKAGDEVGIVRTFRTGRISQPITLVVGEVGNGRSATVAGNTALVLQGPTSDTVTAVGVADAPEGARLHVSGNRYITLQIPPSAPSTPFRVVIWRGPASKRDVLAQMLAQPVVMAKYARGGPAHWPGAVRTQGQLAPDTSAYVVDRLTLPVPNPWRRNVRVADVDFFRDGRAAVVTFDGDIWTVAGIDHDLKNLRWKRFASGLYEPLSLRVVNDQIYVYGRDGIVRLHDLNRDGEADFYENFSNLIAQSIESREFPLGMVTKPGGGFYVAKGGALDLGPKTAPAVVQGFRAGSQHSGTILEVSPDGRSLRVFASGLREPTIGVHPQRGTVTSSDQQGNFVPSTPIYFVQPGGYYGVPATAHRDSLPPAARPLLWIPHEVDQSGAGQVWVTDKRMGFGGDALIHLSYGRPGVFRVFADTTSRGVQGAIVSLLDDFSAPLLRGQVNSRDGQLYLAGFQIWGSKAKEVSTLARLRYTGKLSTLPTAVRVREQGVLIQFASALDSVIASDPARYQVKRWNYRRSERYGSGHFMLDGAPGEERLPVASAHLSRDAKSLLLVLPDMRPADQMEISYALQTRDGRSVADTVYLTPNYVPEMNLASAGFGEVDWKKSIASARTAAANQTAAPLASASAKLGAEVYQRIGCVGCHSVDGTTAGKLGPTLRGLYGSTRTFVDGTTAQADDGYLRQSILEPSRQVVRGYAEGMPSYLGVLSEPEVESLVLYIRSLR